METRSVKRKKLWFGENYTTLESAVDRISDLPDPILHRILLLLPIKCIAQTSVLSKRWQSLWSSFPDLDFTSINNAYLTTTNITPIKSSSCPSIDFISQVLTLRDKNSDLRSLRFSGRLSFSGFNRLIRHAIRHNVKELDAEIATEDHFNFPRGVITSESLRVFRLKSQSPGFRLLPCSIMKGGFRSLETLSLSFVILYEQSSLLDLFTESSFPNLKKLNMDGCIGMKHLKICCGGLEDLTLKNCCQLHGLEINCEKLEKVRVEKCFDGDYNKSWIKINGNEKIRRVNWEGNAITGTSSLQNLRCVNEVSVGFYVVDKFVSVEMLRSVGDLLSGFCYAHSLILYPQCLEIISSKNYSSDVVGPFNNLKKLELHTALNKNNITGMATLFRTTPALHTLLLNIIIDDRKAESKRWNREVWDISTSKEEHYWESQVQTMKPFLSSIKIVKIEGFLECENEISLAKFLLKHGKDLQEMTLSSPNNSKDSLRKQKIRSQMMGFCWASSNAKMSFL